MCPSLTIALNMSVIQSAAASPDAVSISDTRPEGPAALPAFALAVAARTSSTVISSAGPLTGFASSKPSLFQSNSLFNKFSKCSFHTSFILVSLIAIFPSLSFTHPAPTTSLFFFTICFAILNKCPFMFSSSNWAPNVFLSNSWALKISRLAILLALQYNARSSSVLVRFQVLNLLRFSSTRGKSAVVLIVSCQCLCCHLDPLRGKLFDRFSTNLYLLSGFVQV